MWNANKERLAVARVTETTFLYKSNSCGLLIRMSMIGGRL